MAVLFETATPLLRRWIHSSLRAGSTLAPSYIPQPNNSRVDSESIRSYHVTTGPHTSLIRERKQRVIVVREPSSTHKIPFETPSSSYRYFHAVAGPQESRSSQKTARYMQYFLGAMGGMLIGMEILRESRVVFAEEDEPCKKMIDKNSFAEFEKTFPDQKQRKKIITQLCKRGLLDLNGCDQDQVNFLAKWLREHHHGVMRLVATEEQKALLTEVQGQMRANREAFVERASPRECAELAVLSYPNDSMIQNDEKLPKGWELFSSFEDKCGYGGKAFINHASGQIVIAHRGTQAFTDKTRSQTDAVLDLLKDLKADFCEVTQQQMGGHQKHALAFAKKVGLQAKESGYRLGIVGHSLGGWLAKISSHVLKEEGIDSYVVCLDPPGTAEVVEKFYTARYGYQPQEVGDFTSYFWLPNLVNCCGTQEGSLYQLYGEHLGFTHDGFLIRLYNCITNSDVFPLKYLLETHSKDTLFKAFPKDGASEPAKMVRVLDWPRMDWEQTFNQLELPLTRDHLSQILLRLWSNVRTASSEYVAFGKYTTWEDIKERIKATQTPGSQGECKDLALELRHLGHYKIEPYNKQELPLFHLSKEVRQFLKFFDTLRRQGSPEALEEFLRDNQTEGKELQFLLDCRIEGNLLIVKGSQSAADIRRKCELLLRCYPEVKEAIKLQDFLIFVARRYPRIPQLAPVSEELWAFPPAPGERVAWAEGVTALDQAFADSSTVILSGDEGSGKSELARQWSESNTKKTGTKVFYFDASSSRNLQESLINFGTQILRIKYDELISEENATDVAQGNHCSETIVLQNILEALKGKPYLLVFDGADELEKIRPILSENSPCKFLITTTASEKSSSFAKVLNMRDLEFPVQEISEYLDGAISQEQVASLIDLLGRSPFSLNLALRYIAKHDYQTFIDNFEKADGNVVAVCAKSITEKVKEAEVALRVLPFFNSTGIPKKLFLGWLSSDEKNLHITKTFSPQGVLDLLREYGVIEEKNDRVFIDRKGRRLLSRYLESQPFPTTRSQLLRDFFRFLNKTVSMNNIGYEDFKQHKQLTPHIDSFLEVVKEEVGGEHTHLVMALYNKSANHKLQSEDLVGAESSFTEARELAEQMAALPKVTSIGDTNHHIEQVKAFLDTKKEDYKRLWLLQYTKSLHYLGKIYFQTGRKELAKSYFKVAIKLRKEWPPKTNDEKVDYLIFRRQGTGWLLLDSQEEKDLHEAKRLYSALYLEDGWAFNHTYCNRQLAEAYHRLATLSESPDTKRHYYQKAMERLESGGKYKGIAFRGALGDIHGKKVAWKDSDAAVLFGMGRVLSDPENPFYDFEKAEAHFMEVLDIARVQRAQESGEESRVKNETLLRTYHGLAKLYLSRLHSTPLTEELHRLENEENLSKAKGCALKAFSLLGEIAYGRNMEILREKLVREFEELDEILKN